MKIPVKKTRVYPSGMSCHFEGTNGMIHVAICDDEAVAVNILKKRSPSSFCRKRLNLKSKPLPMRYPCETAF